MSAISTGAIVFGCAFGGALLGLFLQTILPDHHLSAESKSVVGLGTGLIATMAALLLGLLVASGESTYDTQRSELTQMAAKVTLLDRLLAHYGPEAKPCRDLLRQITARALDLIWSSGDDPAPAPEKLGASGGDRLFDRIQELTPHNDAQRSLQPQILSAVIDLAQTRALMIEQKGRTIPSAFLVMVVFWLTVIFMSFGLFAPRNITVVAALLMCALSVASAIFLVLELSQPFSGLVQISRVPLQQSLMQLGH